MEGSTRRQFLLGTGALVGGGIATGTTSTADSDSEAVDVIDQKATGHGMTLSGRVLSTDADSPAHRLDVARKHTVDGWVLDVIDLLGSGDNGRAESDVRAEDLTEGGRVVLLAAHNERGTVVSPVAHERFNHLLPD